MLLFAFGLFAANWLEYRLSTVAVPDTVDAHLGQFSLDMLILVVWAFLPVMPASTLPTYVAVVAVFVALQGVWDALLLDADSPMGLVRRERALAAVYGGLLLVSAYVPVSPLLLFAATVLLSRSEGADVAGAVSPGETAGNTRTHL